MDSLLQKITEGYLDDSRDNGPLLNTLNGLSGAQLQVVMGRIKEVEQKHGECRLLRVNLTSSYLSVSTDHPDDSGVDFDRSTYSRWQ